MFANPEVGDEGKTEMIGYMGIREQVDADFSHAVRRAFLHRIGARLRGNSASTRTPSFEEAARALGARNRIRLGRKVVAVEKIVGSVGRVKDFDRAFLPARHSLEGRWKRVDSAFHLGLDLPPVVLYKLGESYFVLDGNHRISVARYQGVPWIEAEVTQFYAPTAQSAPAVVDRADSKPEKMPQPAAA